tara:strand:- start:553 stop:783 length:231 start_codon:yes stop_codon:yes gene_type:complete
MPFRMSGEGIEEAQEALDIVFRCPALGFLSYDRWSPQGSYGACTRTGADRYGRAEERRSAIACGLVAADPNVLFKK